MVSRLQPSSGSPGSKAELRRERLAESRPIRILQCVNIMDRAGLETMLMNHYRNVDRTIVQFDFLTHRDAPGAYDEEIRALGGAIYSAPRLFPQNVPAYRVFMTNLLDKHKYSIVHSHIDAMSTFPLMAAKRAGVGVRIAHSHSTQIEKGFRYPFKLLSKQVLPMAATQFFACSAEAGQFLFGGRPDITVVKNAIDLEAYRYDPAAREAARTELLIRPDQLTLGHVGRFDRVKNHGYLLQVLQSLLEQGEDAVLVLVGDGPLRQDFEQRASELGFVDRIRILGPRGDVPRILQAMDYFVFPSLFEGVPLAVIEAQAAGLPVLMADTVSREVSIAPTTYAKPLGDPTEWAIHISRTKGRVYRPDASRAVDDSGYDIRSSAKRLEETYVRLAGRR